MSYDDRRSLHRRSSNLDWAKTLTFADLADYKRFDVHQSQVFKQLKAEEAGSSWRKCASTLGHVVDLRWNRSIWGVNDDRLYPYPGGHSLKSMEVLGIG